MPVTIGVFINPGHTARQKEATDSDWGDGTNNRRVEYNALDDKYSKLIIDELLPVLKKTTTSRMIRTTAPLPGPVPARSARSPSPGSGPTSSGKVISTIGSFTNIMGGHVYPDLILKSERKPIRIFLQDGVNDNRGLRRGGQLRPHLGLACAEPQDGRRAHGEEVRRELHLGHRHAFQQARAARSCRKCSAGSGATIPRPDDPKDPSNRSLLVPSDATKAHGRVS